MSIIEVTVATVMLALLVASIFPIIGWLIQSTKSKQYDAQASVVLTAGVEVAYNVFLADWDGFGAGTYHPAQYVSGEWTLENGEDVVDARFNRKIEVKEVCRNNDTGEVVEGACGSGSSIDINSRLVTTTVRWKEKGTDKEIQANLLLTDI